MAFYILKCTNCAHTFESIQRMDAKNKPCIECGHETEKLLTYPGYVELKGEGFYKGGVTTS